MNKQTGNRKGFTILEVVVVVAIISLLIGITVDHINGVILENKIKITRMFVNNSMKVPLVRYQTLHGKFPSTRDGLGVLLKPPPFVEDIPKDPWGKNYQYRSPGKKSNQGYDLYSYGPDGVESDDDIGNWKTTGGA